MAGAHVVWEWPDSHRDLVDGPGVGVLATIGPNGMPQVTAVVHRLGDDGLLKLSLRADRQKVKNMSARPMATLFLLDLADTQRCVEVRATVEMTPDDADGAAPNRSDQPGRYVVTLHPERINVRTSSGTRSVL